jgi:hypothetical protein
LEEGAVNTSKLAAGAVTAAKLADESTVDLVTALPVSGAFIGQLALDTSTSKAYIWNGSSWVSFKAAGSINTAIGSTAGVVNVTVTTSGDQITIGTTLDDTANAAEFLAGPSGAGGAVSYRAIVGADLPVATTTAKGGVQVNGNGLTMSGDTLAIDNTITPNTTEYHLIQYDGNGLVTDGREIQSGDLPLASVGLVGAVYPGTGLAVSNDGELNHINVVAAGTATKITFDAEGHVTAVDALADTDIPNISAGKLTSGTLDVGRIANKSIEGEKLADYATAKISNAAPTAEYIGQLFFNPLDRTLFMWDGNVYQPIGVSFGQIIFSGTYDASTNLVSSVTTDGAAIGLAVGASLVSPTGATRAHYVVVDIAGTGTAPAPAVALAPPDIILSTGTDWTLLDVSDTVVAQLASNVQVTPAGDIASTNVQAALQELDTEKLPKAGGTMTGNLELGAAVDIIFEGANANANETTLTVVDPTADRTITLPDVTGTVVTTGDTGTVTSTMIADGTIVNADINASAAIADTKLATIVSSGKVSNSATTATNANTASAIVARDASGNFSAGTITANLTGTASAIADNTVTSAKIVDGTIVNADVNASAAIAGTKISPDFGSQTVQTTGIFSHALGTASAPTVTFTGDTNTGIYSPGADQVAISTNGTGRLFVDASGNVGVGTASPLENLHVRTGDSGVSSAIGGVDGVIIEAGATRTAGLTFHTPNDRPAVISFSDPDGASRGVIGYAHNGDFLEFRTAGSERMRLDSTGRLGLGTSAPNTALAVRAQSLQTFTNNPYILELTDSRAFAAGNGGGISFRGLTNTAGTASDLAFISGIKENSTDGNYDGALVFGTRPNGSGGGSMERVRITSAGRVGIGTTSPGARLDVNADGGTALPTIFAGTAGIVSRTAATANFCGFSIIAGTASTSSLNFGDADDEDVGNIQYIHSDNAMRFITAANERARIDSSGRVLIGTSTSVNSPTSAAGAITSIGTGLQLASTAYQSASASLTSWQGGSQNGVNLIFNKSRSGAVGTFGGTALVDGSDLGHVVFAGDDGAKFVQAATILGEVDGTPGTDDMPGRLVFSTTADGASSPTERMRIHNTGVVSVATTNPNPAINNEQGISFLNTGTIEACRASSLALRVARKTDDGDLVNFLQDGTPEGSISVAGNTVSYNQFLGAHWSALADWSRPEIKIGTILETINELTDWKYAVIEVEGEQKKICYNGTAEFGSTVTVEYEGEEYEGIVELEASPEFNKAVKVKVNDTAASRAVYGVFVGWNNDSNGDGGIWNDMYVGAVGNYVIRMAEGQEPEIGDLVEADGTGCAVVQDDDIIRTRTVAKITSTIPQVTYEDGSFLVTCVLYCG